MSEFGWIEKYFMPLAGEFGRGLKDDGAVFDIPAGMQLVISSDTSNRDDHFVSAMPPYDAARKCLRSNLSDLAAMGADPLCYQLNLALPRTIEESWVAEFSRGLAADQAEFGIALSGGDTTGMQAGGLSVSITILGLVPAGKAVPRGGARLGDLVVVSGILGDASLNRLHIPSPPLKIAPLVRDYAHAAIDISDGLPADLGHICKTSGLGARLELAQIPFSAKGHAALKAGETTPQDLLIWGEDYELAMAVPAQSYEAFKAEALKKGVQLSAIGHFVEGAGVDVLDDSGTPLVFGKPGWAHF